MRSKLVTAVLSLAVAFLLATNPVVADAAKQIGSSDIKNNGVKSVDIRNGAVKLKDLHRSAKRALAERAAFTSTTGLTSVAVSAGAITELRAPISLTVPAGVNFVAVSGGASYAGSTGESATWFAVDAATCLTDTPGSGYDFRAQSSTQPTPDNGSFHVLMPAAPGVHRYRLCGFSTTAATAVNAQLLVQTIAGNAVGGSAPPKAGKANPSAVVPGP